MGRVASSPGRRYRREFGRGGGVFERGEPHPSVAAAGELLEEAGDRISQNCSQFQLRHSLPESRVRRPAVACSACLAT